MASKHRPSKKSSVLDSGVLQKQICFLLPLLVFAVYLSTATPVVYLGDSGELTAAAFSLGIPHPSGYPLFSLLGKMFCMVPLGNVGFRMNLMSGFFTALSTLLIYSTIRKITQNVLCSSIAALFLAFIPLFWFQTVSAEVYPLHCFFTAAMIRLLFEWEERREFRWLLLFVFVTGLSFANHIQTVMMAPPILYFIVSGDKKALFSWRRFLTVSLVFVIPLSIYLYLPIRTEAGAAMQWGTPDNLERFWAHITAKTHRSAYVFSAGASSYLSRLMDTLTVLGAQFGVLLLFSLWGWIRLPSLRWKILFGGIIFFDFFYTLFLNVISLEITPFGLPTAMVLSILTGIGLKEFLDWVDRQKRIGRHVGTGIRAGLVLIPIIALTTNYAFCDQRRNYTAYEHAVNIFRTVQDGSTLFMDGDNNVFPVAYGRIVEGMGQGITLNDRHNLLFKWRLPSYPYVFSGSWDELKTQVIREVVNEKSDEGVYFALFNPHSLPAVKGYDIVPYGMLKKTVQEGYEPKESVDLWAYYSKKSYGDDFNRDYMTREVTANYFFRRGENLWQEGRTGEALRSMDTASEIGYDDTSIHSDMGIFFADRGLFRKAREELEKALACDGNPAGIHNNWGYYYHMKGDYEKAVIAFEKAVELAPEEYSYYNNLGFTLNRMGRRKEALKAFGKSLAIESDQPDIRKFVK